MYSTQKFVTLSLLATVLLSPSAVAQERSITSQPGGVRQQVPCTDRNGRPIPCPWEKVKFPPINRTSESTNKPNPCNPKGDQPVDTKKCRDYILGNPTPPIKPKK